jgi:hypothetical protein
MARLAGRLSAVFSAVALITLSLRSVLLSDKLCSPSRL